MFMPFFRSRTSACNFLNTSATSECRSCHGAGPPLAGAARDPGASLPLRGGAPCRSTTNLESPSIASKDGGGDKDGSNFRTSRC